MSAGKGTSASRDLRSEIERLDHDLAHLRHEICAEAEELLTSWLPLAESPAFRGSAQNLAHYLALRHRDLSSLQERLAHFGLSTLGRSEGRVLQNVDAVLASLALMSGRAAVYPSVEAFDAGNRALREQQDLIFGPEHGLATRIMVTLPLEAATTPKLVDDLLTAGMSCARINCAHDGPDDWRAMARLVRTLSEKQKRSCRILMDLPGPKCRIETVHSAGNARIYRGDKIAFVTDLKHAHATDRAIVTLSLASVLGQLSPGQEVWINDGRIGTRVLTVLRGRVEVEAFAVREKGQRLESDKGINFPQTQLNLPFIEEADRLALDVIAETADLVAISFVQRPEDIASVAAQLEARSGGRSPQPFILKIETPLAVQNLPQLIVHSGAKRPTAVMIARGDLAVELGFTRLSEIQEEMLWICEAAHVPVVWATQVLDNLISDGFAQRLVPAKIRERARDAALAKDALIGIVPRRPHSHDLHGLVPIIGGRHCAAIRAKADQRSVRAERLAAEFADVELPLPTQSGGGGVADVGIMRPDDGLRLRPARLQKIFERVEHMPVAQVPGRCSPMEHQSVILLRRAHDAGVLHGVEPVLAILQSVGRAVRQKLTQLRHHGILPKIALSAQNGASIGGRLILPGRQTPIAIPRKRRRGRIDAIKIDQHRGHGGA